MDIMTQAKLKLKTPFSGRGNLFISFQSTLKERRCSCCCAWGGHGGRRCVKEMQTEKRQRPGQCHTRPDQSIREIGTTNCRLHSLKPETPVCSAGHCHTPDSRHCSVSVCVCVYAKIKDVMFQFILFRHLTSIRSLMGCYWFCLGFMSL